MFLKSLKISSTEGVIRNINFKRGLNLIVDNTSIEDKTKTGNNVGKTTVLKLIDVCFGAKPQIIYNDNEDKKKDYNIVKDFVENKNVTLSLQVTMDNINSNSMITLERNFLSKKFAIRTINGKHILEKDYEQKLLELFFPNHKVAKPTFRQIVSHNNRYSDETVSQTIKTLSSFSTDTDYEMLYLFLLGCDVSKGQNKENIEEQLKQENNYKKRIENGLSLEAHKKMLKQIESEIESLNKQKIELGYNDNLENDLDELDAIKNRINLLTSELTNLDIRKGLINETIDDLNADISNIDVSQLKELYNEVKINISQMQKTFEELLEYHNKMIQEKIKYVSAELPKIDSLILEKRNALTLLLEQEQLFTKKVSKLESFELLEEIIEKLTKCHRQKGEYEAHIKQISSVDKEIDKLTNEINDIGDVFYSEIFNKLLDEKVEKFNHFFSKVSTELYGENYVLLKSIEQQKNKGKVYKFSTFNRNLSSGKKQGEILCFDIAYILYARSEGLPCLEFLLNDKKELLCDNQLIKVADFVEKNNIQLVISILRDKLPSNLISRKNIILELSQEDKLLKIKEE